MSRASDSRGIKESTMQAIEVTNNNGIYAINSEAETEDWGEVLYNLPDYESVQEDDLTGWDKWEKVVTLQNRDGHKRYFFVGE